jgi:hypothetical protein
MAMMVMIVVVLASFIKVESTLASAKQAETVARFNALAAVRLAGAALQERLGPDTRVSAYSSIYEDPANSSDPFDYPVLGVWRSWEGLNHDVRPNSRYAGRPEKPDYTTKLRFFNPDPTNAAGQRNRFLGWMISSQMGYGDLSSVAATGTSTKPPAPPSVVASANTVPLVGSATDVKAVRQVNVEPISFIDGRPAATTTDGSLGYFSWWVGGENQKVRVVTPTVTPPSAGSNSLLWSERTKTFGSPDLAAINYPTDAAKLYHDVSLFSEGLLTNTATGGLRKDWSLFTETWDLATSLDSTRAARMPLFRLKPAGVPPVSGANPAHELLFQRPLPDSQLPAGIGNRKRKTLPYWWADYGSLGGSNAGLASDGGTNFGSYGQLSSFPPVRSWAYLTDHCLHYRKYVTNTDPQLNAVTTMLPPQAANASTGTLYNYYERVHRHPLIARIQYVFASAGTASPPKAAPGFLVQPVVTLWNPFNVRLTVPSFGIKCKWESLPIYIRCVGEAGNEIANRHVGEYFNWLTLNFTGDVTLDPGQTRVYAMPRKTIINLPNFVFASSTDKNPDVTSNLVRGYDADGTSGIQMQLAGLQEPGTKLRFVMSKDIDKSNLIKRDGIYYDNYPVNYGYSPVRFSFVGTTTPEFKLLYGADQPDNLAAQWPVESHVANPRAFGTFAFGLRLSNDGVAQYTTRTGIKTVSKGVLQASPFTTYTELGQKSAEVLTAFRYASSDVTNTSTISVAGQIGAENGMFYTSSNGGVQYAGALNVINAPYDLYFLPLTDFKEATVPQVDAADQGYILTGQDAATGLPRAAVAELPVKPLQSLASLQNCDIRATNPAPPFHYGLIGNSDASPILPPDDAVGRWIDQTRTPVSRDMIPQSFLQYDDSYCLNHVLFDDWFVSSLAPRPADWAALRPSTGNEFNWNTAVMTSLQANWSSFAAGTTQLPNTCYQPASNAAQLDLSVTAGSAWQPTPLQPVAYQRIAASLRVPGQFNVNSTSVAAWRAMLGNLRSTSVPYIKPANSTVTLATNLNNPLPRMSVSHEEAVSSDKSRAVLGFASLTNAQLDLLAVEMVEQVKLRGPFLSLSEFVNRQLAAPSASSVAANRDPSLTGAIGAALKALELAGGATNPADRAQAIGKTTSKLADFSGLTAKLPMGDWHNSVSGNYAHPKAAEGSSTFGLPGWPRQADVLERLAPVITVRDDTFVVRAMGTSPLFNGASGRVWCEAVYQRLPEYVDPSVPAHEAPAGDLNGTLTASRRANAPLGRRMRLVSFRWLNSKEL